MKRAIIVLFCLCLTLTSCDDNYSINITTTLTESVVAPTDTVSESVVIVTTEPPVATTEIATTVAEITEPPVTTNEITTTVAETTEPPVTTNEITTTVAETTEPPVTTNEITTTVAETTESPVTTTEISTTVTPEATEQPEVTAEIISATVSEFPAPEREALFVVASAGDTYSYLVFDEGLTFYVKQTGTDGEIVSISECTLLLPYGYTDGELVGGSRIINDGVAFLNVLARYGDEVKSIECLIYPNELHEPVYVVEDNGPVYFPSHPVIPFETVTLPDDSSDGFETYDFNARYKVFLTYSENSYENAYVFDLDTCEIVYAAEFGFPRTFYLRIHSDGNMVLYSIGNTGAENEYAVEFKEKNGSFSHSEVDIGSLQIQYDYMTSPNGSYCAWQSVDDNDGGIDVKYPDGSVKRIRTNVRGDDLASHRGYGPFGFIDETHLLYWISGYEWMAGYGIYDFETGEYTEVLDGSSLKGIYSNVFYTSTVQDYEDVQIYKHYPDGKKELIASRNAEDGQALLKAGCYYEFKDSMWCEYLQYSENPLYRDVARVAFLVENFTYHTGDIVYPDLPHGNLFIYNGKAVVVLHDGN